ncbi:MAG: zinc ribbon domain-containing protein [Ruminococcaceae bacterium]|nr:zinc ribbon domain-containing protein [Oscillospiraceae bacterium]
MARYIKAFQVYASPQDVFSAISQYLQNEGYEYLEMDGENVFKKGNGFLTNPTLFKFTLTGNRLRMETWSKYALLPGVFVGELDLNGFVGSAVKGPWKKRVAYLEQQLTGFGASAYHASGSAGEDTAYFEEDDEFGATQLLQPTQAAGFCSNCGTQLPAGSAFCTNCGQQVSDANAGGMNAQGNPFEAPPATSTPMPAAGTSVSRKEFIEKYAPKSVKSDIKAVAITCYVCAAITFGVACAAAPAGIIDALLLAGFALGMHLLKSRVFAVLILVLSIVESVFAIAQGATAPVLWIICGVAAIMIFVKLEKQYKDFKAKVDASTHAPM